MPSFADDFIVLRQIADYGSATGKAFEVVEAPAGKGVMDAVVDDGTYKTVYDAILRATVADCTGDPIMVNFLDGGFP